jgi:hypothetical protein
VSWQHASVFAIALGLATGCAEHLRSIDHGGGWSTGFLFWPPPDATSTWLGEPTGAVTLGDAAARVASALRNAGYIDQHWFPIGVRYEHGFAVTTRLEQTDDGGTPTLPVDRWPAEYADAVNLLWITRCQSPYLHRRGRYRALLVAFTDLHVRIPGRPLRFDETTAMDGPGLPANAIPSRRRVPAGYRVGVYIYEYEAESARDNGTFLWQDASVSPAEIIERAGLSALTALPRTDVHARSRLRALRDELRADSPRSERSRRLGRGLTRRFLHDHRGFLHDHRWLLARLASHDGGRRDHRLLVRDIHAVHDRAGRFHRRRRLREDAEIQWRKHAP